MRYRAISTAQVAGKILLIRVDLNVPMKDGHISDDTRLRRLVPGLKYLIGQGGKLVLLSHFGRPKGAVIPEMSLAPIAPALSALLGQEIGFCPAWRGREAQDCIAHLKDGQVLLLENMRFDAGEEGNDPRLAAELAQLGELYVNDAFSAVHRAHASTAGLAQHLPSYAGALMEQELLALETALSKPKRPLLAVVGGAKVSTKFDLLSNLCTKVDCLVIGGGMANTFLLAQGYDVGTSLCEPDLAEQAALVLKRAATHSCQVILPSDAQIAPTLDQGAKAQNVAIETVPAGHMILDFGPQSTARVLEALKEAATLIWNGPLGAFEFKPFNAATQALAKAVAAQTKAGALVSIAGGGDTVAALTQAGVSNDLSYISTAGGAFLEWMEGRTLPGVAALGSVGI